MKEIRMSYISAVNVAQMIDERASSLEEIIINYLDNFDLDLDCDGFIDEILEVYIEYLNECLDGTHSNLDYNGNLRYDAKSHGGALGYGDIQERLQSVNLHDVIQSLM